MAKTARCDMVLMTVVCPEELVLARTRIPVPVSTCPPAFRSFSL